ncbi:hypothetical protein Tco_0722649 [Tanacetum coccineum]
MVTIKEFAKQHVNIDLIPVGPNSFDVIISRDQLSKYHAVIVRGKEIVCIPYGDEILINQGSGQSRTPCLWTLCLSNESLFIPLEEIQADDRLHSVGPVTQQVYAPLRQYYSGRQLKLNFKTKFF